MKMSKLLAVILLSTLLSITLGAPQDNIQVYILNGTETPITISPYVVSLSGSALTYTHVCGGVIIGLYWVLTAAHCLDFMSKDGNVIGMPIYAGLKSRDDYEEGQKRIIDFAFKHKAFNGEVGSDDIALLHVSEAFEYGPTVRYATLPYIEEEFNGFASATYGWGLTDADALSYVSNLQVGRGKVIDADECRLVVPTDAPLSDSQVCVEVSACYGDGGSPLIAERDAWPSVLVGITSWGYIPCGSNRPTVYTNVAKYPQWIADVQSAYRILYQK